MQQVSHYILQRIIQLLGHSRKLSRIIIICGAVPHVQMFLLPPSLLNFTGKRLLRAHVNTVISHIF